MLHICKSVKIITCYRSFSQQLGQSNKSTSATTRALRQHRLLKTSDKTHIRRQEATDVTDDSLVSVSV